MHSWAYYATEKCAVKQTNTERSVRHAIAAWKIWLIGDRFLQLAHASIAIFLREQMIVKNKLLVTFCAVHSVYFMAESCYKNAPITFQR